jgi:hypothetical protein
MNPVPAIKALMPPSSDDDPSVKAAHPTEVGIALSALYKPEQHAQQTSLKQQDIKIISLKIARPSFSYLPLDLQLRILSFFNHSDLNTVSCVGRELRYCINLEPIYFIVHLIQTFATSRALKSEDLYQRIREMNLTDFYENTKWLQNQLVRALKTTLVCPREYKILFDKVGLILSSDLGKLPFFQILLAENEGLFLLQFEKYFIKEDSNQVIEEFYLNEDERLNYHFLVRYLPPGLILKKKDFLLRIILKNPSLFLFLPLELKKEFFMDYLFIMKSILRQKEELYPAEFNTKAFLFFGIECFGDDYELDVFFLGFNPEIVLDPGVWIEVAQVSPSLIARAPRQIQENESVILAALQNGGTLIQSAHPNQRLKSDAAFIINALQKGMRCSNLIFVNRDLNRDPTVIDTVLNRFEQELLKPDPLSKKTHEDITDCLNKNEIIGCVAFLDSAVFCTDEILFHRYRKSASAALKRVPQVFRHIDETLKKDADLSSFIKTWMHCSGLDSLLTTLLEFPNSLNFIIDMQMPQINQEYAYHIRTDYTYVSFIQMVVEHVPFKTAEQDAATVKGFCNLVYQLIDANIFELKEERLQNLFSQTEIILNAPFDLLLNFNFIVCVLKFYKFESFALLSKNEQVEVRKRYKEMLLYALKTSDLFIQHVPDEFRKDTDIQLALRKEYRRRDNQAMVKLLADFHQGGYSPLRSLIPKRLREELGKKLDAEFAISSNNPNNVSRYFSPALRKDKPFILYMFQATIFDEEFQRQIIEALDPSIAEDVPFWLELIKINNGVLFRFSPDVIKGHPSLALCALQQSLSNFAFIEPVLKQDRDFIRSVIIYALPEIINGNLETVINWPEKDPSLWSDNEVTLWGTSINPFL